MGDLVERKRADDRRAIDRQIARDRKGALRLGKDDGAAYTVVEPNEFTDPPLNVNVPAGEIAGVEVSRLGKRRYQDRLDLIDEDSGRKLYRVYGDAPLHDGDPGTDLSAIANGLELFDDPEMDEETKQTALDILHTLPADKRDPYHVAEAVQDWLYSKGGFTYTTDVRGLCETQSKVDCFLAIKKGYCDVESVKRYTGFGTGMCQGKQCHATVASLLAREAKAKPEHVLPFTPRPPLNPTELSYWASAPFDSL